MFRAYTNLNISVYAMIEVNKYKILKNHIKKILINI